ncbi:hypothetical protein [Shinella zoogloeoides]|uniref:hypothetical protein n=1 Tax=Shinella zoogloeoides TaxID=352475 RepID=UPI00273E4402|nr:hypothetical protein [Shinella zoogloeoides]WLR90870.1 hypothetical protein Q9316_00405 [Shinella zoogloeoides]
MEIGRIQGATRVLGKAQGYLGLPLKDVVLNTTVDGPETPAMMTAWLPNPEEIAEIVAGAPVILTVLGTRHPPVLVTTGHAPDDPEYEIAIDEQSHEQTKGVSP